MTVLLRNDFHKTEARVRAGELSARQVHEIRRKLCGMSDCKCSGELGTRGPQPALVHRINERWVVERDNTPTTEEWYAVEFSPRDENDWALADSRTADSVEDAHTLMKAHKRFRRGETLYEFRVVRKTLVTEVVSL